jgi:hypothetical protein
MQCEDYALHASRDKVFDRLCDIWTETKESTDPDKKEEWGLDIWRKANTLQAVAQYWNGNPDAQRRLKAMNLMLDGYRFYEKKKEDETLWVDDFGWWAGFFRDLSDYTRGHPFDPPLDQDNLLREAQCCYTRMLKNLDSEEGGIWNHCGAGGEKNTVTNVWMLNVASDLFNWTGNQEYRTKADEQYTWLTTGKSQKYSPKRWHLYAADETLLWLLGPDGTAGTTSWSGNEGVFLRGLSAYILAANPPDKQKLVVGGKALINAAMKAGADAEHVMHEYPNSFDWSNDLATGKGVFMRLVTRFVFQHSFFGDCAFEESFKRFVGATAKSVWCSRDAATNTTANNWNPGLPPPKPTREDQQPTRRELWPQVWQTDGLDALNAAVRIGL